MYPYPSTAQSPSSAASAAAAGSSSAVINNGMSAPSGEANTTAYHSPEELRVLNIDPQATKGLFVGDLSSFCSEKDLYAMFVPFGPILAIEIKRGRHGDSLLHGFVEYDSVVSSFHAVEAMHGRKIMGRRMRVNWTNIKVPPKPVESWTLVQVHFVSKNIQLRIDEEFLDNVFAPFGDVIDVIVKRHEIRQSPPQIRGYGNVYFLDPIPAMKAIMSMKGVSVSGVQFECSLTMPKSGSMSNANSHTNSGMNSGFNSGFNSGTMTPTPGGNNASANANIISNNMHNNMINNNNNNNSTGSGNLLQQALSGMSGFSGSGTPPPPPQNTTSPSMSHLHRMTTPGSASSANNNNNSNNNISNAGAFMAGTNKSTHSSSPSHALSSGNNNASANITGEASTSGINFASSATAQQQRLLYLLEKEKELIRREKELLLREQLAVQLGYYDLNHPQLSQLNNNTNNNTNFNNAEEDNRNILHLPSNNNSNNNANGANHTHSKLSVSPQMSPHFINNMTNNNNNNNNNTNNNNLSSNKSSKDSSAFSFDFIPHIPSAPQSTTTSFYQSNTSNNNINNNTTNNNNNTSSSNTGVSKHPSIIAGLSLNTSSWDLNDPLYALSHSSSQPNVFLNMNNISNFPTLNNNNMYPHYNNYSQGNSQANSAFNSGYNSGVISHTGSTSSQSTATHASVGHGSRFTFDHIPLSNNNVAIATPGTQQPSLPPTPSSSGHSNKLKPPLAMSPSHAKEFAAGFFSSNSNSNSGDTLGNVVGVSHNNNININNEDIFAAAFSKMGIAEEYNALTNDPATEETRHQFGALESQQQLQQGHSSSSSTVDDLLDAMIDEDATRDH